MSLDYYSDYLQQQMSPLEQLSSPIHYVHPSFIPSYSKIMHDIPSSRGETLHHCNFAVLVRVIGYAKLFVSELKDNLLVLKGLGAGFANTHLHEVINRLVAMVPLSFWKATSGSSSSTPTSCLP